jgi:hypothetical protein
MVRKELGPHNNEIRKERIGMACSTHDEIMKLIPIFG